MKTPFKDWGIVNFLQDNLPDAIDVIGDVAAAALGIASGANPVTAIADLLTGKDLTKQEILQAQKLFAADLEREKLIYKDRADARDMQTDIATSEHSGWLARNFVYLMSAFILLAATGFGIAMIYVEIPTENQRMVEMFADVFLFAGAVAVVQYFIGQPNLKGFRTKYFNRANK